MNPRHRRCRPRPVDPEGTTMSMDLNTDTSAVDVKSATPTLEARGLVKTFGHVVGLAGVDLQLYPGEGLAIIGDNGAGKSTLIKGLSGARPPDEGEILVDRGS